MNVVHAKQVALSHAIPGVSAALLERCGINSTPTDFENPDQQKAWFLAASSWLTRKATDVTVVLGLALEDAYRRNVWEGYESSWKDWLARLGIDEARASKLRTIGRVLVLQAGVTDVAVAAVGDETKMYVLAVRGRRLLAEATTEADTTRAKMLIGDLVAEAPRVRREDLRASMDEAGVPKMGECTMVVKVCKLTMTAPPDDGCEFCRGEGEEEGIGGGCRNES